MYEIPNDFSLLPLKYRNDITQSNQGIRRMAKWKNQLEIFRSLRRELSANRESLAGKLRFARSVIIASDVASQFYCEKKVEMKYLHGEVETEEKTIGSAAHEKLEEDAVNIEREDLWKKIYGGEPVLAVEMFILARYRDIVLGGMPDSILFQAGMPLIIFEFKFSQRQIAYLSHHIQSGTYGVILEKMGFDTSRLFYAVVTANPRTKGKRAFREEVMAAVIKNGPKEAVLKLKDATVHLNKFQLSKIEDNLNWAIEFWKQKRKPTLTTNPNKCCKCEYQIQCRNLAKI